MFNLESLHQLDAPRDLAKIFDTTEYAKWKSFRASEDSRYVGLCLPRMLLRLPYGKDTVPVEAFDLRRERRRHGSQQVPVEQRGVCAGGPR